MSPRHVRKAVLYRVAAEAMHAYYCGPGCTIDRCEGAPEMRLVQAAVDAVLARQRAMEKAQ